MDERRSSQFYPRTPAKHLAVFILALFGFTVLMLGLTGCDARSPETVKKSDKMFEDCRAECDPYVMNEFATGFAGSCRCTSDKKR